MQGIVEFVRTLGAARIAAMAAVTVALVGFFAFLIMRATAPVMAPLFTDLTIEDSSSVVKELERQGISYEIKNDGSIILVPSEKVARLRMSLAESGLPKGGSMGYEIFDKSDSLGTTSFVQNINHLRALEGELARTIRSLDRVQAGDVLRLLSVCHETNVFASHDIRLALEHAERIVVLDRGRIRVDELASRLSTEILLEFFEAEPA